MEVNFEMINAVMQWIVLPIAGVVIYMFNKQAQHQPSAGGSSVGQSWPKR